MGAGGYLVRCSFPWIIKREWRGDAGVVRQTMCRLSVSVRASLCRNGQGRCRRLRSSIRLLEEAGRQEAGYDGRAVGRSVGWMGDGKEARAERHNATKYKIPS